VFAEAVPRGDLRRRPAERAPGAVRRITRRHHRGLRIHRLVQRFGRSFVEQRQEMSAEYFRRLVAHGVDFRQPRVALEHADRLRPLAGENHGELHRVTSEEPQVKPPPTPCISTRWPTRIFPARMYSSSASGTDAADVLPWWSTVTTSFSRAMPSFFAVASRMRTFAWCGMSQSTSASV